MKNSDMKIIAIILSIALFFTIVTSNAVSIASVVFLAKGETAQTGTAGAGGDSTSTGDNSATNGGSTVTPADNGGSTVTPADNGGSATTPADNGGSAATPAGNSGSNASTPAGNGGSNASTPANNGGSSNSSSGGSNAATSKIDKEALAMYQKASKDICQKAVAGYTKKGWQAIEGDLQLSKGQSIAGTLKNLIMGFMTQEADAEEKINAKGSDDAKNRMVPGNCSESYLESVTKTTKGNNYVITIIMKDQVNPSYNDADGLVRMSKEFLDIKDVQDTVKNDATVSKVVKSVDGTITYKAYKITAEMTKDGKFVSITHYGVGDIKAHVNAAIVGELDASGALSFNARYYDFKY